MTDNELIARALTNESARLLRLAGGRRNGGAALAPVRVVLREEARRARFLAGVFAAHGKQSEEGRRDG